MHMWHDGITLDLSIYLQLLLYTIKRWNNTLQGDIHFIDECMHTREQECIKAQGGYTAGLSRVCRHSVVIIGVEIGVGVLS